MACRCAPALVQLRHEIDLRWPARDKASDGCCGDPAHAARKSDHNPVGGFAHALDIDENLHRHDTSPAPLKFLIPILLDDPRSKYVIYEGRIAYPDGTNRAYSGANPHDKHLHLSIKPTATHDTRPWLSGPTHTTAEDGDMTPDQAKQLADIHALLTNPKDPNALRPLLVASRDNTNRLRRMIRLVAAKVGVNPVDLEQAEKVEPGG